MIEIKYIQSEYQHIATNGAINYYKCVDGQEILGPEITISKPRKITLIRSGALYSIDRTTEDNRRVHITSLYRVPYEPYCFFGDYHQETLIVSISPNNKITIGLIPKHKPKSKAARLRKVKALIRQKRQSLQY